MRLYPTDLITGAASPPLPPVPSLTDVNVCACRVSEAVRIAGSLIFVLLLFIFTAVLVKVHMEQDRFFSVTMATIWFINCEWAGPGRAGQGSCFPSACCWMESNHFSRSASVWRSSAGEPVWSGGPAAPEVQRHLHERPGPRRDLRCHRHAVGNRQ